MQLGPGPSRTDCGTRTWIHWVPGSIGFHWDSRIVAKVSMAAGTQKELCFVASVVPVKRVDTDVVLPYTVVTNPFGLAGTVQGQL